MCIYIYTHTYIRVCVCVFRYRPLQRELRHPALGAYAPRPEDEAEAVVTIIVCLYY